MRSTVETMTGDIERLLAYAKTPRTRARIRRLVRWKRVFRVLAILGVSSFVLAYAGILLVGIASIFFQPLSVVMDAPWWVPLAAMGVASACVAPWGVAAHRLEVALYADGTESRGIITEIVVGEDSEQQPRYSLSVTAELSHDARIHRFVGGIYEPAAPKVGQVVRFRHNTRDPDDLHDILFIEVVTENT